MQISLIRQQAHKYRVSSLTIIRLRDRMLQVDKLRSRDREPAKKKPRRVMAHPRGASQGGQSLTEHSLPERGYHPQPESGGGAPSQSVADAAFCEVVAKEL